MCGLAGQVSYAAPPDEARVLAMSRALAHRGPDGDGQVSLGAACLAHRRLALVDPEGGAQPMRSADGRYALVYNGEVYNAAALRAWLKGRWTFRDRSDTEVVLALLALEGASALTRLNGMFALFFWDEARQEGFAARDRLGVKPFVYSWRDATLTFASEAKAIVTTSAHAPNIDSEGVLEYLVAPFYSGVSRTMFDGVKPLLPGHLLRVTRDGITLHRWWRWAFDDDAPSADVLADAVVTATRRALIADSPLGIYLSGGLDSTLIAAAARSTRPLETFTIAFESQDSFDYAGSRIVVSDDEPFADRAAQALGLERRQVPVARRDLRGDLASLSRIDDALPAWEQELAQHHLARAATRSVKAVLVGDAADETHWGYHFLLDPDATAAPDRILRRFGSAPIRPDRLTDAVAHFAAEYRALTLDAGHDWTTPPSARDATARLILERWLPRLLHNGDIHAMAYSLEARVPFADIDLLALAARTPARVGFRDGVEKSHLRDASRGLVPEDIRVRRKSALPKDQATAAIYQREASCALDENRAFLGELLALDEVRALCVEGRALTEAERAILFRVICLSHWARHYGLRGVN